MPIVLSAGMSADTATFIVERKSQLIAEPTRLWLCLVAPSSALHADNGVNDGNANRQGCLWTERGETGNHLPYLLQILCFHVPSESV